jgi:hypothetical protein
MNEVKPKKFKDPYLKPIILDAVKKIEEFAWFRKKGDKTVYYEGNFQEDVLNNFSKRESDEIFSKMRRYLDDNRLLFLQKKVKSVDMGNIECSVKLDEMQEPKYFYEYIVSKR